MQQVGGVQFGVRSGGQNDREALSVAADNKPQIRELIMSVVIKEQSEHIQATAHNNNFITTHLNLSLINSSRYFIIGIHLLLVSPLICQWSFLSVNHNLLSVQQQFWTK